MKLKTRYYQQTTNMTCGAATALMILSSLGLIDQMTESKELSIYSILKGKIEGTSISALLNYFKNCGLHATLLQDINAEQKAIARLCVSYAKHHGDKNAEELGKAILQFNPHSPNRKRLSITHDTYREILNRGEFIAASITTNPDDGGTLLHWVVIDGYDDESFHISDPYFGEGWLTNDAFDKLVITAYGQMIITVSR